MNGNIRAPKGNLKLLSLSCEIYTCNLDRKKKERIHNLFKGCEVRTTAF